MAEGERALACGPGGPPHTTAGGNACATKNGRDLEIACGPGVRPTRVDKTADGNACPTRGNRVFDIDREHPEYKLRKQVWRQYRDLYVGGDQLRLNAQNYLVPRQREPGDVYRSD